MSNTGSSDERLREAAEWLTRLSCSNPSEEDVRAWSQWCESDQDSVEAFESLEALWCAAKEYPPSVQAITALLAPDSQPDEIDRPWARQRRSRWGNFHPPRIRLAPALVGFALFAVIVLVCVLELLGRHASQPESLSAALAQQRTVVLKDGSKVDLGARSAIEVEYSRKQRLLALLSGEAYFQDKHDASWPFVVTAANVEVVATGTAFDIEKDTQQVAVSVVEGSVNVSIRGGNAEAMSSRNTQKSRAGSDRAVFELQAGEKLTVSATGLVHFFLIDKDSAIAWREGRLEFADASLNDVVETINRYASRPLVIADPSIASERFSGTVFLRSIDEWIDSLPTVFPVTLDRSNPESIILSRR
jgi:transmembrane sensor